MCLARLAKRSSPLPGTEGAAKAGYSSKATKGMTQSFAKLPPMGGQGPSGPRLASLDWPPPPSPANGSGAGPGQAGLGATIAMDEEQRKRASTRHAEIRARAELWAARSDVERAKLRSVAPYPFFGRAMRFQDEFSALQITDDGRFSYSTATFESTEPDGSACDAFRNITTFEGVLIAAPEVDDMTTALPSDQQPAPTSREEPEVAAIEGRALVRHEIEERGDFSRLVHVERLPYRFAITVTPFFQPTGATVQMLVKRQEGRPTLRCERKRQLPYTGTGIVRAVDKYTPAAIAERELRHQRRRTQRLKFSRSVTSLDATGGQEEEIRSPPIPRGRFTTSESAPSLRSKTLEGPPTTVADWREYYRQRAAELQLEGS